MDGRLAGCLKVAGSCFSHTRGAGKNGTRRYRVISAAESEFD